MKKESIFAVSAVLVLAAGLLYLNIGGKTTEAQVAFAMPAKNKIVVIDAGHGGWDPGMVGVGGTVEKEINLAIAEKLQQHLEMGGATALVTRASDEALGDTKRKDLDARKRLADDADIMVSIHQNSFPQASVRGAQVFYYKGSEDSKRLAECLQEQFSSFLDPENVKSAKANKDYYMLKKTAVPSVIIECGFLSNKKEGQLLTAEEYQEKVAWTIYMGILRYFNENPPQDG
jgi:N-acetylmuramoyl-L-alanine amidase